MRWNVLWGLAALCAAAAGCALHDEGLLQALTQPDPQSTGGSDGSEPPGSTGGTGGVGGVGGVGGTGGTGGTGGSPVLADASTDGGMAAADAPPSGPDAAADVAFPVSPDSGQDTVADVQAEASRLEAGAGGVGVIECGGQFCNSDTEVCCASGASTGSCMRQGAVGCPAGNTRSCDGPEDCPVDSVCCAQAALLGGYRSSCLRPSDCDKVGAPICRGNGDCFGPYKTCASSDVGGTALPTCRR
jgi:hypothetical protein